MALNIKNEEAHRLAQELAKETGRSMTEVVTEALRDAHKRNKRKRTEEIELLISELNAIVEEYRELPILDNRSADEILGYDEHGLPH